MKYFYLCILLFCFSTTFSQSLKGFWQGYITADGYAEKAYYSINIIEEKDNLITGKAFISRPDFLTGAYNIVEFIGVLNKDKTQLTELKIVDEKVPVTYFFCLKFCKLNLTKNNDEYFLKGRWTGDSRDCIPGTVVLKKQTDIHAGKDSIPNFVYKELISEKNEKPKFNNTQIIAARIIPVKSHTIKLEISDYIKQDKDTVSIYLNRNIVIKNLPVKKRPKVFRLDLNPNSSINEILLYAENLGNVPPNTSSLTIIDGKEKHNIFIESSLQKSVVVYLKKK